MKRITGIMFYYYFVCHRKLWKFSSGISLESENQDVALGKLLDQESYSREKKGILIDETINIDFIRDWKVLHEVKKSKSIEEAGIWQLKYYIYFLQERGIEVEKGVLDYPKLRRREEIYLSDGDRVRIDEILDDIRRIIKLEYPPKLINSKICKKCAYYEYCYI